MCRQGEVMRTNNGAIAETAIMIMMMCVCRFGVKPEETKGRKIKERERREARESSVGENMKLVFDRDN